MEQPSTSQNLNYMGTSQPGNPTTATVWQQCFAVSKRNQMAQKIVKAMCFTDKSYPPEEQLINFVNYARKVERNVYESAHSKGEYYQVLASKIFIIKKALDKKRGVDFPVRASLDNSSSSSDTAMDNSASSCDAALDNSASSSDAAMDNSSSSSDAAISELPVKDAISGPNIPRNPSEFDWQSSQSEEPSHYEGVGSRTDTVKLKLTWPPWFKIHLIKIKEMLKNPRNEQFVQNYFKHYGRKGVQNCFKQYGRKGFDWSAFDNSTQSLSHGGDTIIVEPSPLRSSENVKQMQVPQPAQQSQPQRQPAQQSQPQPQPAEQSQPQPQVKRSNQSRKAMSCRVCLDDLLEVQGRDGKQPVSTICGHLFCTECMKRVIRKLHCCPVCCKHLKKNDYHPIYINQSAKAVSCAVCLDDSLEGQSVDGKQPASTICGHLFCAGCIRTVIRKYHCCPVCRKDLKKKNYHPIYM